MDSAYDLQVDARGLRIEADEDADAEAMVARFTPMRAIWMVVSGGVGRMERRMEKMEVELERAIAGAGDRVWGVMVQRREYAWTRWLMPL